MSITPAVKAILANYESDNPGTKANLARILMQGRLGGTGKLVIFMGIENAKFRAPVTPGCLLDLHVEFTQKRSRVYKFKGVASVEEV